MRVSLLSSVMRSRSMSSGISGCWPVDSAKLRSGSLRSSDARCIMNCGMGKRPWGLENRMSKCGVFYMQMLADNSTIVSYDVERNVSGASRVVERRMVG